MTTSTTLPIFRSIVSSKHHQLLITESRRALKQSGNKLTLRLISSNRGSKVKSSLTYMSFRVYDVCCSCVTARQTVPADLDAVVVHRVAVGHNGEPPWLSVATWLLRHQSACQLLTTPKCMSIKFIGNTSLYSSTSGDTGPHDTLGL